MLGLARSGVAATRMLLDAGAQVTVYDRRAPDDLADALAALDGRKPSLALAVAPAEAERLLAAAELVITSPSISPRFPTTEPWLREALAATERRGVPVMGEVDLFLSLTRARVLAVTGTKGKTTTTALIGAMLDAAGLPHAVGGNIGTPLIERVDELGPETGRCSSCPSCSCRPSLAVRTSRSTPISGPITWTGTAPWRRTAR